MRRAAGCPLHPISSELKTATSAADCHTCRIALLHGFAGSSLCCALPKFEKACWQGPPAQARLDGSLAQQDLVSMLNDTANDLQQAA